MITIVMAYYNRQKQLDKTLESLRQYNPKDFNVIIVDNASDEDIVLPETFLYNFSRQKVIRPYDIEIIKLTDKSWQHCVTTFNTGFLAAIKKGSDIIIMQGAECSHSGDLISYVKNMDSNTYTSFGCYSLGQGESPETVKINNRCQTFDGDSAWYNHLIYNARALNFCSAISTENLIKLNGFDERFKDGCGYEDDYFLYQIRRLGLKIEIISEPFVFHQWHPGGYRPLEFWHKNLNLFNELSKGTTYRAQHILTPDL